MNFWTRTHLNTILFNYLSSILTTRVFLLKWQIKEEVTSFCANLGIKWVRYLATTRAVPTLHLISASSENPVQFSVRSMVLRLMRKCRHMSENLHCCLLKRTEGFVLDMIPLYDYLEQKFKLFIVKETSSLWCSSDSCFSLITDIKPQLAVYHQHTKPEYLCELLPSPAWFDKSDPTGLTKSWWKDWERTALSICHPSSSCDSALLHEQTFVFFFLSCHLQWQWHFHAIDIYATGSFSFFNLLPPLLFPLSCLGG